MTNENTTVQAVEQEIGAAPETAGEAAAIDALIEEVSSPAAEATPVPEPVAVEAQPEAPVVAAPEAAPKKSRKSKKKIAPAATGTAVLADGSVIENVTLKVVEGEPNAEQNAAPPAEPEVPAVPPAVAQAEEAAKLPPFKLFDNVPFGGPGSEKKEAIPVACSPENAASFLLAARDVLLAVLGERDGVKSPYDRKQFHTGIRQYLPIEKFKATHGGTGQPITPMDEEMYAVRVAHRLLAAVAGKKIPLNGALNKRTEVLVRANHAYEVLVNLAAEKQIPLVAE